MEIMTLIPIFAESSRDLNWLESIGVLAILVLIGKAYEKWNKG